MSEFNVNNDNREEVAVYLAFVWELCRGRSVHVVPPGLGAFGADELGLDYELVKWEFEVEVEDGPRLGDVLGFRQARTSSHWQIEFDSSEPTVELAPEEREELDSMIATFAEFGVTGIAVPNKSWRPMRPPGWDRSWLTHAALYAAPTFEAFRSLQATTLCEEASSVDVYAISPGRHAELVESLRADVPPQMQDVLGPDDVFASVNLGVDMDFSDVLLVQARKEIGGWVDALSAEFQARIGAYEAAVDDVADLPSLLDALARLAGVAA